MAASTVWDPSLYERYAEFRRRPLIDLVARVGVTSPRKVVDLGCGNGLATLSLVDLWPTARIVGIDNSPDMLRRARELDTADRVEWVELDAQDWPGDPEADVVVSNAMMQWLPQPMPLLRRWLAAMPPEGWFAVQVPGNFESPSHTLLADAVRRSPQAEVLLPRLRELRGGIERDDLCDEFVAAGLEADVWETTYVHLLDPEATSADPVLDWVRGTALRPVLGVVDADAERHLIDAYAASLRLAYPREAGGVRLPFRRLFAVGQRRGAGERTEL